MPNIPETKLCIRGWAWFPAIQNKLLNYIEIAGPVSFVNTNKYFETTFKLFNICIFLSNVHKDVCFLAPSLIKVLSSKFTYPNIIPWDNPIHIDSYSFLLFLTISKKGMLLNRQIEKIYSRFDICYCSFLSSNLC